MKTITILPSNFHLWKLKYNNETTIACPKSFTFPCMSFKVFPFFWVFSQFCNNKCNNNIKFIRSLNCYLHFLWLQNYRWWNIINNIVSPLKTNFLTSVWEKTLSVDIKNELSLPQCERNKMNKTVATESLPHSTAASHLKEENINQNERL